MACWLPGGRVRNTTDLRYWNHPLCVCEIMEAVRTSETSVIFNETTRRYIPEDYKLHTLRRENLKSHNFPWTNSLRLDQEWDCDQDVQERNGWISCYALPPWCDPRRPAPRVFWEWLTDGESYVCRMWEESDCPNSLFHFYFEYFVMCRCPPPPSE